MNIRRLEILKIIFIAVFIVEGGALFYWQIIWNPESSFYFDEEDRSVERGKIYDRRGRIIAMNELRYSIFADPSIVSDPEYVGKKIGELLGRPEETYINRLKQKSRFVWIERKLEKSLAERIVSIDRGGIFMREDYCRVYLDCNMEEILGCVDIDNRGISGIELTLDERLSRGEDVYLSIDSVLQSKIDDLLSGNKQVLGFSKGIVIVMSPYTGEILALVNYPHDRNFAIQDVFEPGSSFKPIVASIALEEKCVREDERFNCRPPFIIKGVSIKDAPHQVDSYDMTLKEILEVSSNIGIAQIGLRIGPSIFYRYVSAFGFGSYTGVELSGETPGILPQRRDEISITQNSFGQGIGVNALQLVAGYAPLANGGYFVRPTILKVSSSDRILNQIISGETSKKITGMLVNVVENGTGRSAKIDGVEIAGKTGTAQKVVNGRYSMENNIMSFIGYLPAYCPKFIIGVILDEPKVSRWASDTAAPLFKKIAEILLYDESLKGDEM
ncbi:TPA: penicillin-binding protein 2 [bacterium]|nr:penicillin-binding protein 2 [bacterium]HPO82138.1 penicillin-binding protein 2 [bacterium]